MIKLLIDIWIAFSTWVYIFFKVAAILEKYTAEKHNIPILTAIRTSAKLEKLHYNKLSSIHRVIEVVEFCVCESL